MSLFRSLSASLLSAAASFSIVTASGCGTSAIGVDDCRSIEYARCEASLPCGTIDDVAACKRYSRDHCLHGLLVKPSSGVVGECVRVIKAAGQCANQDPEATLADCDPTVTDQRTDLAVCDVIAHPERSAECAFLLDEPPDTSTGGQPGAGGNGSGEPAGAAGSTEGEPSAGAAGQPQ